MNLLDTISNDLKNEILFAMSKGECTTIEDVVETFGVEIEQVISLFNDTAFMTKVGSVSKASAKIHFHSKGLKRLRDIADGENDKVSIAAIKVLAEYAGELTKKSGDVNVQVSLENHIREAEYQEKEKSIDIDFANVARGVRKLPKNVSSSVEEFDIDLSNDLKESDFVGNSLYRN